MLEKGKTLISIPDWDEGKSKEVVTKRDEILQSVCVPYLLLADISFYPATKGVNYFWRIFFGAAF